MLAAASGEIQTSRGHRSLGYVKDRSIPRGASERVMVEPLLPRVASGDTQAIAECIDRYGGLIWSLARRLLANAADAEDAVQEVYIELWKNAARYDVSVASETTFVAMIARRRLIDRRRKESRRIESDAVVIDDLPLGTTNGGENQLELTDEAAHATAALQQLRPEEQKVLRLAVCQGWSHQLIAERLCLPLGTVKTHVRRGLIRVREQLESQQKDRGPELTA